MTTGQAEDNGGQEQSGSSGSGCGEMWSDHECTLKVGSTGFADRLNIVCEKNKVKIILKFFVASVMGRSQLPLNKIMETVGRMGLEVEIWIVVLVMLSSRCPLGKRSSLKM